MNKGDLKTKGFAVGEVNDLPNLDLPKWGYYRHIDGRVVFLPADPITLKRNRNKGFIFLGNKPLDEPLGDYQI